MIADYTFLELRSLAAVLLKRYGHSVLAEVIQRGIDPHVYTAALLLGLSLEEFLTWKGSPEPVADAAGPTTRGALFKRYRQAAKAINFGVPGGMGPAALVASAHESFGVELTLEEATAFRERLIRQIYPELGRYLDEDVMGLLASGLGTNPETLWAAFDPRGLRTGQIVGGIRNVVRGKVLNASGQPYSPAYLDRVWSTLVRLCTIPAIRVLLEPHQGSPALADRLFGTDVVTLTGRIRAAADARQARNSPFQALAADGAKAALWKLVSEGFHLVGFIHDEMIIEVPDEGGFVSAAVVDRVREILCSEMAAVLGNTIPVACEIAVATCWAKDAELIERDGKVYPWSPPAGVVEGL